MVNKNRIFQLNHIQNKINGPIVYWMCRDQRVDDNWALLYAQELAIYHSQPLCVVFCLRKEFQYSSERIIEFMIEGHKEIENRLLNINIPFYFLSGEPDNEIPNFINRYKCKALVTDFFPLKWNQNWKNNITQRINIPFYEVDAHNIVPCRIASNKKEYGAYTIRPKISRLLPEYLTDFPKIQESKAKWKYKFAKNDWSMIKSRIKIDRSISNNSSNEPGEKAAFKALKLFLRSKINNYSSLKNDPTKESTSNLSSYLHFGQISAQRIALEIKRQKNSPTSEDSFLEELIIRKELSDNFCHYENNYDSLKGFPSWAKNTLEIHGHDKRIYIYNKEQLESAQTHDKLWNIAQTDMIRNGKMHGYIRMYWAKKILEWTKTPEEALSIAIEFNDKYFLDGRDPNGYTGIAWSIGGVHDRPWFERPIFGQIRYMSINGLKKKFDLTDYINQRIEARN